MRRITKLDAQDLLPSLPPLAVTGLTSASFIGLAVLLRMGVNALWPNAGPFSVNIPAVLLATLVGRMQAGMIVLFVTVILTWYYVLPLQGSFVFENPDDGPRTAVNMIMGLLVVLITEVARKAARALIAEREERIRERDLLLREVDHRVKNNLTILASLLAAQQRKTENSEVQQALEDARGRVFSLAKAYDFLNLRGDNKEDIEMRSFLENLVEAIHKSGLNDGIRISVRADKWHLDRTHAGATGLLVNELITNAVKHAFAGRNGGSIDITLDAAGEEAVLKVKDDGVGFDTGAITEGKGTNFLQALARTARAELSCESGSGGTCYTARLTNVEAAF